MTYWQQIQTSFRGSIEGTLYAFAAVIVLGFTIPLLYILFSDRLKQRRKLSNLERRLRSQGLSDPDLKWVHRAVKATCPDNPARIVDSQSLFHSWIDGLEEFQDPEPELVQQLEHIREIMYPDGTGAIVPHSTRDLIPGASVNVVYQGRGQEVSPGIITEVNLETLRVGKRAGALPLMPPGAEVSLFYPRPEAMYHAICKVLESQGSELRLSHAVKGRFNVRQLREFWRVDVDIPLEFSVYAVPGSSSGISLADSYEGRLINLSGSGAAILTRKAPPRGARIGFTLNVQVKQLAVQAEVLHLTHVKEHSRLHLVFRNLDPGDQELIIRSLFARYREEMLRHGGGEDA